jgi:hypothetical protein
MQKGSRVTSTIRAGSQKPTGMPGVCTFTGPICLGHMQIMLDGLSVSGSPRVDNFIGPIDIGNIQDQQTSVIGFKNLP